MESDLEIMLLVATRFVGLPYIWGSDNALVGFDCSGYVCELLQSIGIVPSHYRNNAQGLYVKFKTEGEPKAESGALAFYGKSVDAVTHVAMLLSPHLIIEAGGGDSKAVDMASAIKEKAYVRVRPLNHRSDLVAIMRPKY